MPTQKTIRSFYKSAPGGSDKTDEAAITDIKAEYSNVHRDIAEITKDILSHKQKTVNSILEIGKLLNEAKTQLEHGEWLSWLEDKVDIPEVTAQRYMRLAREYSNPSALTDLGYTKAYKLLALSPTERETFITESHEVNGETKDVSEMSTRELEEALRNHKNKRNKEDTSANESVKKTVPDESPESAGNSENADPVTVLMKKVVHLENFLDKMLESFEKQVDNSKEQDELTDLLRKVLNKTLQKLSRTTSAGGEQQA